MHFVAAGIRLGFGLGLGYAAWCTQGPTSGSIALILLCLFVSLSRCSLRLWHYGKRLHLGRV